MSFWDGRSVGCGSVGDVGTVAGSNLVAVPCCGKKSRSMLLAPLWLVVRGRRRRWWNILEHYATWHVLTLILPSPPPVPHDTCPSGGKNHMHDSPVGFAHGPVVQRPGNCRHPFNISNSPSCQSIVVMVESKAALVALLPLAPQISRLINSLPSSIIVESFHLSYEGLCLSTTSIPTPSDLFRVETFMRTLIPKGFSVWCKVPSSRSFCKLIGVLFLHGGNPINLKDASLILASSC